MSIHLKSRYLNEEAIIEYGHYSNGEIAVLFRDIETGEPLTTATVNLEFYNIHPSQGNILVKNSGANKGMVATMLENGIITHTVVSHKYGYDSEAVECVFSPEYVADYWEQTEVWRNPSDYACGK